MRRFNVWRKSITFLGLAALLALTLGACSPQGEDRPGVTVLPGVGSGSTSGSASGSVSASVSGAGGASSSASVSGTGSGTVSGEGIGAGVVRPKPAGANQVTVSLAEWAVMPDRASVPAGQIYFLAQNVGPVDPHELAIIRTDLAPDQLPVVDGKVPEDQVELVGEIEPFLADSSASGVFNLAPGNYVLICNIAEIEEGQLESHYQLGMRTAFTVTAGGASQGGAVYTPVSNVDSYLGFGYDIRDMVQASGSGLTDWTPVAEIYNNGKNITRADGTKRTIKSLAVSETTLAQFPNGAELFGNPSFLDARMMDAFQGTGRAAGLSPAARRHLVEKGISSILYGKAVQELEAARTNLLAGKTDSAGAPHNVDEGWGLYECFPDETGAHPWCLSATAQKREANFGLQGKLDTPILQGLNKMQQAAGANDVAGFDAALADVKGRLRAIFYLATLRYAAETSKDTEAAARETHLAEGWAFYQTIRPIVAEAAPDADTLIEGTFTGDSGTPVAPDTVTRIYTGLNQPAVLSALGIPEDVRVATAP